MSITFKAFTALIAEGKQAYSSESQWKTAAEEAGYVVKKLSGDSSARDQTWGAFDDDKKVGEFGEADGSGWLSGRLAVTEARANQADTKAYLKSLGLGVGQEAVSDENYISFTLRDIGAAVDKLTEKFGEIARQYKKRNGEVNQRVWKVPGKGFINVTGTIQSGTGTVALMNDARIDELFGIFRNNEKKETPREKLKRETAEKVEKHRADQAKRNGQGKGDDVDPNAKAKPSEEDEDEEEDDRRKKTTSQTRSASTRGTRTTQSAAQGRAAERDWTKNA